MELSYEETLTQWEPKLHQMVHGVSIRGMEYEEILQTLRVALWKAWSKYRDDKGASFHTYLHVALRNTLASLVTKASKMPYEEDLEEADELEMKDIDRTLLDGIVLNPGEQVLVNLMLCGYKMSEICRLALTPSAALRVFLGLKMKLQHLVPEY